MKHLMEKTAVLTYIRPLLTLSTLGKNFINILKYFSYFFQKIGFDTSCKLSMSKPIFFGGGGQSNFVVC